MDPSPLLSFLLTLAPTLTLTLTLTPTLIMTQLHPDPNLDFDPDPNLDPVEDGWRKV